MREKLSKKSSSQCHEAGGQEARASCAARLYIDLTMVGWTAAVKSTSGQFSSKAFGQRKQFNILPVFSGKTSTLRGIPVESYIAASLNVLMYRVKPWADFY